MRVFVKTDADNQIVKYPYTYDDLRKDFKGVIFPKTLEKVNVEFLNEHHIKDVVDNEGFSDYDPETQKAFKDGIEFVNGVWQVKFTVVDKTEDDITAETLSTINVYEQNIQVILDKFAQERGYDDIKSACDYAGCNITKFDTEGTYCKNLRAETWDVCYQILSDVENGIRPLPTFEEVVAELPTPTWPV